MLCLTLELSGGEAVALNEWLGDHPVSHESKVQKHANRDGTDCKLHVTQQLVSVSIYSDLDVIHSLVTTLS